MKKLLSTVLAIILAISMLMFAGCAKNDVKDTVDTTPRTSENSEASDYDTQYVLYLGTNDKDTVEPVFTPDVCKEKAIEVLLKHFGGYTISEANGGWIDDGKIFTEYTLVIYLSDTTLDEVHSACDELIEVFNQSSILIQSNQTKTEFYSVTGE